MCIFFNFVILVIGGGIETDYYTQWKRTLHNIEKISHLPDTISRLYEACGDYKSPAWLMKLEGSGWLRYVESCLLAALKTATFVHRESENDYIILATNLL